MTKLRYRNFRRRLRNIINKLSSSHSEGRNGVETKNCMRYHRIVRNKNSKNNMSVGCFGNCSFNSENNFETERSRDDSSQEQRRMTKMHCRFYPPIQTVLREKDTEKWYTDMVNELAAVGDDPNELNEFGEPPLCVAAHKAQGVVVADLLQRKNIQVNIKGRHGRTPLYIAAEEGHVFVVKCLLAQTNIDVNSRNNPGCATPLMIASRRGHSRIVELLLQHPDCDPNLLDRDGNNASRHARTNSVKYRLHNFSYKSKSVENVMSASKWPSSNSQLSDTAMEAISCSVPNYHCHSMQHINSDLVSGISSENESDFQLDNDKISLLP